MGNIDQLKTEVDDIKQSLNDLKDNVTLSETEKKEKADSLKKQAESTKDKIQTEISALADKTDDESKRQKEEAETLLYSFNEAMNLYNSIIAPTAQTSITEIMPKSDKVDMPVKSRGWVGEQWDDIWDKDKWANEGGKNLLRTAGFVATGVGAISLAYKGLKKLFGKDEKEEKEKSDSEKKGFWNKRYGKALKWTGIGTLAYFGIKYIKDKKEDKNSNGRSSDKEKYESYDHFVNNPENKEKFENYEQFGEYIDILYEDIYSRELKSGYEDELGMDGISDKWSKGEKYYKGIVPYCLDNQFKNVDNILGQNSSMKNAIANRFDGMLDYIKGKGNDFLKLFVESYLDKLPSWIPFKDKAGSLLDRINEWKLVNKNAENEMQYFFRQSIRVQTYLFEKKDQLVEKLVKEASMKYNISEKNIYNDDDNFKKYVENNLQYQNFIKSPISSATLVLQQYGIFDTDIRPDLKDAVKEIDKQRDKILGVKEGEKDIIQIINEKEISENITENEDKLLGKACEGIVKDVDDTILDAVNQSARNIYGDLWRSNDANLRQYLNTSGLESVFREYQQIIKQKKLELEQGRLSREDKLALAESINNMFALKKEALLGKEIIEKDYDEHGNVVYRIGGFLRGSVNNLVKSIGKFKDLKLGSGLSYLTSAGLGTGLLITATGAIHLLRTGKTGLLKTGAYITTLPASAVWSGVKRIKPVRDYMSRIDYVGKYWGKGGAEKLLANLNDGYISLEKAGKIVERNALGFRGNKEIGESWKSLFGIGDDFKGSSELVKRQVLDTLIGKTHGGQVYLNTIKGDKELYENILKNFDSSKELRLAIKGNKPVDDLRRVVSSTMSGTVETVTEALKNNKYFIRLSNDIDSAEKSLSIAIDRGVNDKYIEKEIDNLTDFRNSLNKMTEKELEQTSELLDAFKGERGMITDAIDKFTVFKKLADNKTLKVGDKNIGEILDSMDYKLLRKLKGQKISGISDDAIEGLAKAFERINIGTIKKLFNNSMEAIAKLVKNLVKWLARLS